MITLESLEREENKMTKNINEARFVTVSNGKYQFIWAKIGVNTWVETFFKKFDGEEEFTSIHTVKYLNDEDVEEFANQLVELGYTISVAK